MDELRNFLISYHSLDNYNHFKGKDGAKKLMERLGTVQYDVLNVVGRNPDLVLQSRVADYKAEILEELLYSERFLIDGWDNEMSIYLTKDWKNFSRIREHRKNDASATLNYRRQNNVLPYEKQVIEEIKKRGPLMSREIKLGETAKNRWGHREISGALMDYLYLAGKLGVYKKQNTQKVYDLIENIIPKKIINARDPFSKEDEFLEWYFHRRIGSLGAVWNRSGTAWLGCYLNNSELRKKAFTVLAEKKKIIPINVPELNEVFYIQKSSLSFLENKPQYDSIARFLAPLDNLIWDRNMVKKVFNFEYTWEVYVPEAKRKYGYYVLPVLYQNKIIARMEPFKYIKGEPLKIKNWWWETSYTEYGTKIKSEMNNAVKTGLNIFASYLGANGIDKGFTALLAQKSG